MPTSPMTLSRQFLNQMKSLPLWVKQVVFLELLQEFKRFFAFDTLHELAPDDSIALYVPSLTPDAPKSPYTEVTKQQAQMLESSNHLLTVLDMCILHEWSLESLCIILYDAIESGWIKPPHSPKAMATLAYLSNNIRLGEYLVRMSVITQDQLTQALRTQLYIQEAMNEHTGLANIMINLGYVTRRDTEGILFLKEESKKPLSNATLIKTWVASTVSHN